MDFECGFATRQKCSAYRTTQKRQKITCTGYSSIIKSTSHSHSGSRDECNHEQHCSTTQLLSQQRKPFFDAHSSSIKKKQQLISGGYYCKCHQQTITSTITATQQQIKISSDITHIILRHKCLWNIYTLS